MFFNVFLISKRFFIFLKNVGKVQSGKQINKKHFQNNSNEIDLWFFLLHVEWPEMPPYKLRIRMQETLNSKILMISLLA